MDFYRLAAATQLAIYNGVVLSWREKVCLGGYTYTLEVPGCLLKIDQKNEVRYSCTPGYIHTQSGVLQADGLCQCLPYMHRRCALLEGKYVFLQGIYSRGARYLPKNYRNSQVSYPGTQEYTHLRGVFSGWPFAAQLARRSPGL